MTPEQLTKIETTYNIMQAIQPLSAFDHFCVGILAARVAPEFTDMVFDGMLAEAIKLGDPQAHEDAIASIRATVDDLMELIKPKIGQN